MAAAILFFVCGGIYLNWRYEERRAVDLVSTLDAEKVMDDALLVIAPASDPAAEAAVEDAEGDNRTAEQTFAKMRLSRQQSRDSAVHLLQETISYAGENEDVSVSTLQLESIVNMSLSEASIESLIISKGFTDCVAYMKEDGIDVAVASQGLSDSDVAVLTDIILSQTEYELPQIRIIEVK